MGYLPITMVLAVTVVSPAQQVVRDGPPPEIRALVDATVQALNADARAWEAFAQARFAAALLQKQSPEERARAHAQLAGELGTVALERVMREGPDAPLLLHLKGVKASGAIELVLGPGSATPRIAGMRVRLGDGSPDAGAGHLPPLPVNGSLPPDDISARLDGYFTRLVADDVFSGVVLVARLGAPVFFKAYGLADRDRNVANTTTTRFNIGSINKVFTQVAIRQLVQAGRLAYTDTLGKYFPDHPQAASRAATIEQLLTHRGGIADFFGPEFARAPKDRFASNADYFAFVSQRPPAFAPGELNAYCNGCYVALGAIVARVSGMPYEEYVARQVFARAGMTRTGYPRTDRIEPDMAIGYTRRDGGSGALTSNIAMHGVAGSAAGGGYSTAEDLLAFVRAVRAGEFPGAEQGLGIAGGAPGVNAVVEARGDWTVIVLTNLDPPTGERLGVALADALTR
jgi:D-alanyl-D-alanine carboxypeptidase